MGPRGGAVASAAMGLVPVFDLDGTLLDSDEALVAPFLALGIERSDISFGHPLDHECERLGVAVADYLDRYDVTAAAPFPGVVEVVDSLGRWAVCSNKRGGSGRAELARLGWCPQVALFVDDFDGPKRLGPVLDALGLGAGDVLFVGDTAHDRLCAEAVGARFVLAGWNPRARPVAGDLVATSPGDVLALLDAPEGTAGAPTSPES
jgi:phosphoglycolate phosphatase-like HAD superfamily hydrolase